MINQPQAQEVIKRIAEKYNISYIEAELIIEMPYRYFMEKVGDIKFRDDHTLEELESMDLNFGIKGFGKLIAPPGRVMSIRKKQNDWEKHKLNKLNKDE